MGLSSAFRRVWSSSSSSRKKTPRRSAQQERVVIASYRDHVLRLTAEIADRAAAWDRDPHDHAAVPRLRALREQLVAALESYHAALGARDEATIKHAAISLRAADNHLTRINHQILAEVDRFELASLELAARYETAVHPTTRLNTAADAHDVLVELEIYGQTWVPLMDPPVRSRLDYAHSILRLVVDDQRPSRPPAPAVSQGIQDETRNTSRKPRKPRKPRMVNKWPSHISGPGMYGTSRTPNHPIQESTLESGATTSTSREVRAPTPPPSTINDREYGSSESGDSGPMHMVISRSRTLRDVAANVMSGSTGAGSSTGVMPGPPAIPSPSPVTSLEQPELTQTSHQSFASTLYHTRHARIDSISDAGVVLRRSNVRGDGRCMFRALARGRIVARGQPIPDEDTERVLADELRAHTVAELKKHRQLLARFFVIEGNFHQYTRKMSHPRTYGGEPELLMLAKLLHVPVAVYILKDGIYRQIQVYGKQYRGDLLRILYSDGVHYDALLSSTYKNTWQRGE